MCQVENESFKNGLKSLLYVLLKLMHPHDYMFYVCLAVMTLSNDITESITNNLFYWIASTKLRHTNIIFLSAILLLIKRNILQLFIHHLYVEQDFWV